MKSEQQDTKKMVKIHYDPETGLRIGGAYPNEINYPYPIPEPYLEISEDDYKALLHSGLEYTYKHGKIGIYKKSDDQIIEELKIFKEEILKVNHDFLVNGSQIFTIKVDGIECPFALRNDDLPMIEAIILSLSSDSMTAGWKRKDGKRIELNRTAFKRLQSHINVNNETVRGLYFTKLVELNRFKDLEEIKNFNTNLI